jgi:hypothetical protein
MDWINEESGFDFQQEKIFSFLRNVHTGSSAHPASYSVHIRGFLPEIKQQ